MSVREDRVRVTWAPREPPLAPAAVLARGRSASQLASRLLARTDEDLGKLRGVAGTELLLVLGAADLLPWADGVTYLGRDPAAPALLLPTTLAPNVPTTIFERTLTRDAPGLLVAVVPDTSGLVIVPAATARTIARTTLAAWASRTERAG